jgi:hypothetical protein
VNDDNNLAYDIFNACLSHVGQRKTSSKWVSFNAVCCRYNGESVDTRKRGGLLLTAEAGIVYSCFNCSYKAGWRPGSLFSKRLSNLLVWFGVPEDDIKNFNLKAWRIREHDRPAEVIKEWTTFNFKEVSLPIGAKPFSYWVNQEVHDPKFLQVLTYMSERGECLLTAFDYYWTPHKQQSLSKYVIIPFTWKSKIVGWTARASFPTRYRYMSDVQPHYLFNIDSVTTEQNFIIVCEGPFDAIAVNGVATLGDKISTEQRQWLRSTGKHIIILPDRVKQGGKLVDIALEEGWYVSFPKWDEGVKDAAEASKRYGKLYTLWSVISERSNRRLTISTLRQMRLK